MVFEGDPNREAQYYKQRLNDLLELAKDAPRVTREETEETEHLFFGNNFSLLFVALKKHDDDFLQQLLKRSDKDYTEEWETFIWKYQDLIREIKEALDDVMKYKELYRGVREFIQANREKELKILSDAIDPALGIEAIGIAAANELNPLLKKAAECMREVGMPPERFF